MYYVILLYKINNLFMYLLTYTDNSWNNNKPRYLVYLPIAL